MLVENVKDDIQDAADVIEDKVIFQHGAEELVIRDQAACEIS